MERSIVLDDRPPASLLLEYAHSRVLVAEARTGVTFADGGDGWVNVTIAAGLAADPHWSTGAFLWWRMIDSITGKPAAGQAPGRHALTRARLEFETLPAAGSGVQVAAAFSEGASRALNYVLGGGDFSAGRLCLAARHLSGATAGLVDTGGLGAFDDVYVDTGVNVGTGQMLMGQVAAIGVTRGTWDPNGTPWDQAIYAGNIAEPTFVGLAVRAVGVTVATTARVRVRVLRVGLTDAAPL